MDGWVKLHRSLLDWEWYDDHKTTRLFIYLILKANHEDKKWRGVVVKNGSLICGIDSLSKNTGLSIQNIRTSLSRLKSTDEITIKTTKKYSVISINNWDSYQQTNKQTNKQLTNNQQASNNKQELKNIKNEKKEILNSIDSLTDDFCLKVAENYKVPLKFVLDKRNDLILYCRANGKKYKDYQAALQSWVRKDKK